MGAKPQCIGRNQAVFQPVHLPLHRRAHRGAVQVAVKAALDPELAHHFDDLWGACSRIDRRIVKEHDLLLVRLPRRFKAGFQAAQFPVHHLFVVRLVRLEEPAAGAAEGKPLYVIRIVVQQVQAGKTLRLKKASILRAVVHQ